MYNANKTKQVEGLKSGIVNQGVIIQLNDGRVADFLSQEAQANWKGNINHTAIEIVIETEYEGEYYVTSKIFTYTEKEGVTVYKSNSNLAKYFKTYNKLPEVEDKVNMMTDANGYFRLIMN